ncbi:MAG TPA: hypothetical protein VFX92_13395 [Candidatus Krumholzibacteria bacterium]|nr:hypothetical protein [Candidatus Krumholzibacteria bacterium]
MQIRGMIVSLVFALAAGSVAAADNPPAPGFDAAGSDARAVEIADRTMDAMGGRARWDAVQCLAWEIFGRRHTWNKWTGDYRLEDGDQLVIMNINDGQGRVWKGGAELEDGPEKAGALDRARSVWINDAYWVFMPYKLKDTGVTLKYLGERAAEDGRAADVLGLTFAGVGDTPENRYEVLVDRETGLVSQWSYFEKATDTEPQITSAWNNWHDFGGIKLAERDGRRAVTGIRVSADACPNAFKAP